MTDPYNLRRFVEAQDAVYDEVRSELRQGCKRGHWMWFIFPQISGLGRSATAREFAISSIDEAAAYLQHPVLGPRLVECTTLMLSNSSKTAHEILGYPDDVKFRSSMTLFAHATPTDGVFEDALRKFFGAVHDPLTLSHLRA